MSFFNIYIPDVLSHQIVKKQLFILTRPFWNNDTWCNVESGYERWNIETDIRYVSDITKAHVAFIPMPINYYFNNHLKNHLVKLNAACVSLGIKAYGYVSGDFGRAYPEFSNIVYFRMGGFRSQLSDSNKGFPVTINDQYLNHNGTRRKDMEMPVIGFCGHASTSFFLRIREVSTFIKENLLRLIQNPLRSDWEVLFDSSFQRAKLLRAFEESSEVISNFIYRAHYRAGAKTIKERAKTEMEYFKNIQESDYIVCIRGGGNFSVRFYETLMMGKVPVFINTDCLLPFENEIDWKKHVVWVEWSERRDVVQKVLNFHSALSAEAFNNLCTDNRNLWKNKLAINGIVTMLKSTVNNGVN